MKPNSFTITRIALTLVSANLALGASSIQAADGPAGGMVIPSPALRSGFYLAADAGLNLADDLSPGGIGASISVSPGVRVDLVTGYAIKLCNHFTLAPEVEVGAIYNPLDTTTYGPYRAGISGHFIQVPVMANAVLNWECCPHWVLYAGAGAGSDFSTLHIESVEGIKVDSTGNDTDFAWQGMAGIRYVFKDSEVSLGYKYLAVQPSGLQTVGNNSVMLAYTLHF